MINLSSIKEHSKKGLLDSYIDRKPIEGSDRVRHFSKKEELESYKLKKLSEIY